LTSKILKKLRLSRYVVELKNGNIIIKEVPIVNKKQLKLRVMKE
jgi:hypothetical protein